MVEYCLVISQKTPAKRTKLIKGLFSCAAKIIVKDTESFVCLPVLDHFVQPDIQHGGILLAPGSTQALSFYTAHFSLFTFFFLLPFSYFFDNTLISTCRKS